MMTKKAQGSGLALSSNRFIPCHFVTLSPCYFVTSPHMIP